MPSKSIKVPPMSWRDIDSIAVKTRKKLGLPATGGLSQGQIAELFEFGDLEAIGIKDCGVETLPYGDEGKYSPDTFSLVISEETYKGLHSGDTRAKFTLCHEFGHAVLHGKYLRNMSSSRTSLKQFHRSSIPAYMEPECQANQFAAAFLMPYDSIKEDLGNYLTENQVAKKYNVSYSAACNRIKYVRK